MGDAGPHEQWLEESIDDNLRLGGLPCCMANLPAPPRTVGSTGRVSGLLGELAETARVLSEEAPHDVWDDAEEGAEGAVTTVRALLRKSIGRLDEETVKRFARLGVLPPKPLSFDPWTAQDVWRDSPKDADQEDEASEEEQARDRRVLRDLRERRHVAAGS